MFRSKMAARLAFRSKIAAWLASGSKMATRLTFRSKMATQLAFRSNMATQLAFRSKMAPGWVSPMGRGVGGRATDPVRRQAVQQQLGGGHLAGPQFVLQPLDLDPLQLALGVPADLGVEQGQTPAALGGGRGRLEETFGIGSRMCLITTQ